MSETIDKLKEEWGTLVSIGWVESISENGEVKLNPSASMEAANGEYIGREKLEQMFKEIFLIIGDYMLEKYRKSFYYHGVCDL